MITTIIIKKKSFDFLWPGLCVYEMYISLSLGMHLGLKGLFLHLVRGRLAGGGYFCYSHSKKGTWRLGVVEQSSEEIPNWPLGGSGQDVGCVLQWEGTPKSSSVCPAHPVYLDSLTIRAAHSECFWRSELLDSGRWLGWKCLDDQYSERNRIKIFKSTTGIKCSKYFKWIISFSPKRDVFLLLPFFLLEITRTNNTFFFFHFLKKRRSTPWKKEPIVSM